MQDVLHALLLHGDGDEEACPFQRLGLDAASATPADVRASFRKLALLLHPDKHGGDVPSEQAASFQRARALETRALDLLRRREARGPNPAPPTCVEALIPARLLYDGGTHTLDVSIPVACHMCGGTGAAAASDVVVCLGCQGSGTAKLCPGTADTEAISDACASCGGAGTCFLSPRRCGACGGRGAVSQPRHVRVRVRAGFPDGERVCVPDAGGWAGLARTRARDLLVTLRHALPPSHYVAPDGSGDVTVRVGVPLAAVLCGYQARISAFNGAAQVCVHQPAYVNPDRALRFPGMGLPRCLERAPSCPANRGALVIDVRVVFPSDGGGAAVTLTDALDVEFMDGERLPLLPMPRLRHIFSRIFPARTKAKERMAPMATNNTTQHMHDLMTSRALKMDDH